MTYRTHTYSPFRFQNKDLLLFVQKSVFGTGVGDEMRKILVKPFKYISVFVFTDKEVCIFLLSRVIYAHLITHLNVPLITLTFYKMCRGRYSYHREVYRDYEWGTQKSSIQCIQFSMI